MSNSKKIKFLIVTSFILTAVVIVYLFASGLQTEILANHVMVTVGVISLILGFICLLTPYLARNSKSQSPIMKYLYFLYGPGYLFFLSGLWGLSFLFSNISFIVILLFLFLLSLGFLFNYYLFKQVDEERRAAGEIKD